jgi:hypothetical protein
MNPRSGKDWLPALERAAEEYVTREKGKGQLLVSVFPAVNGGVKGKEGFEAFSGQHTSHILFMLVACVYGVPG